MAASLFYNLLQFLSLFPPAADTEYIVKIINTKGWLLGNISNTIILSLIIGVRGEVTSLIVLEGGGSGRWGVRGRPVQTRGLGSTKLGVKLSLVLIAPSLLPSHFMPINIQLVCKVGRVRFSRQK